jgi:putative ABC transport system ATP-binding protein
LLKKAFVFIGLNSFALFLINQPFIQEFFIFLTRLSLPGQELQFKNLIIGSPENFLILPINTYLPITLSYLVMVICVSILFTKIDRIVNSHLNNVLSVLFFTPAQPSYTPYTKDRPLGIAINGGLVMLLGDLVIILGLAFGSYLSPEWEAEATVFVAIIGIVIVASGYFFFNGSTWAWWLSIITNVLGILGRIGSLQFGLLSLAIPIVYLYYLTRPHVKDYFFARAQETEVRVDEDFLVEAVNVSKIYRIDDIEIKAISDLDFKVARGDFISIMGPSGSGKTTLLNIIGGLDKTTSGLVHFDGENLTKLSETRLTDFRLKNVGFIFQQYNLIDVLSALENVELPTIAAGVREEEARNKAVRILESVGLKHRLNNRPTQLSGGEQQRVAIARALINEPSLIIADEPTGNVDSETGLRLIELLSDLNEKEGVTIILATHDLQIAQKAHRLVRMKDGKII